MDLPEKMVLLDVHGTVIPEGAKHDVLSEFDIDKLENDIESGKINLRDAKSRLSFEIVKMYHGEKKSKKAEREFNQVFQKHELPKKISEVTLASGEYNIADLLIATKMVMSKSEARRLVTQKAVKVGGKLVDDFKYTLKISPGLMVQVGKRRFRKLKVK